MTKSRNSLALRVSAPVLAFLTLQGCGGKSSQFKPVVHGDTVIITGEATCPTCRIELTDSVSIGREGDSVALGLSFWATRRRDGELFVTGAYGANGVVEYDPAGHFVRLLGQKGSGPKEFGGRPTRPTLLRGDTLVVYDLQLRRFMRITPDGTLVGPFAPTFRPWDVTASPDGLLLVTGDPPSADPFEHGRPAHFLRLDGTVIRSVGDSLGTLGTDRVAAYKQVAMSARGAIALANFHGYDITVYFPDGTRRVLSRRANWFVNIGEDEARVVEMWFDEKEHLWVTLYIPQTPPAGATTDKSDELLMRTQTADNIVEVFDIHTGELLTSHRFATPFFVSNGLGIGPVERPSDLIGYTIWRPSLIVSKKSGK